MPTVPQPHWELVGGEVCWTINWRDWFRPGAGWPDSKLGGEMRGFHIVFRLRLRAAGTLVFWDDDGCLIRRNGTEVHHDRSAHPIKRHEVQVSKGDVLEVAQW